MEHWDRTYRAVRTEEHAYVEYDGKARELYDLRDDPYQLRNAYETADPALLEDLESRLDRLQDCSGEGCRAAEDDP